MVEFNENHGECFHCHQVVKTPVFETACEWNRVVYSDGLPCVDVEQHHWIEQYCSARCRAARLTAVMARENVPILRAGLGPVESCANCRGPVDMSRLHLAYLETKYNVDEGGQFTLEDVDYIAVLCRQCAPDERTTGAEVPIEVKNES